MRSGQALSEQLIAARLERLPLSSWHIKVSTILGIAIFFDAFDNLAIATVLPVLARDWHIGGPQIGWLFGAGNLGQAIGALMFGWVAERIGRVKAAQITIIIFAVMSLVCGFAQNYEQLLIFRFIEGIGLGGEVPVAAAYVTEITRADRRGSAYLFYQMIFPVGFVCAAIAGKFIVPTLGWQYMFYLGAVPAIIAVVLRQFCQESPRWLASKGRLQEADTVMTEIEGIVSRNGQRPLAPVPALVARPEGKRTRWVELFEGRYLARTLIVWVLWSTSYLVSYCIQLWLPTIYTAVFKLPLETALSYNLITIASGLIGTLCCALLIDRLGRRTWFVGTYFLSAIPLLLLWANGTDPVINVVIAASFSFCWLASINLSIYLYTAEIYPTRMRALGTSWATFWLRLAGFVGPVVVGVILPSMGVGGVFFFFGLFATLGGIFAFFVTETRRQVLEEVSP